MARIPFVDTHVHFYDLRRKDLVYSWLQPDFVHPQLGDINAIKTLVYDAKAFDAESRFANVSNVVHVQAALGASHSSPNASRRAMTPAESYAPGVSS